MNHIDIIIVSVMLFFIGKGLIKGFAKEIMGLLSFFVAFALALSQMRAAANFFSRFIDNYSIALIIGYIVVFLFVFIVLHIIAGAIHKLLQIASLGWLNRLGGAVFGLLFGGMLLSLTVFMLSFVPIGDFPPGKNDSRFYPYLEKLAPKIFDLYSNIIPGTKEIYNEVLDKILTDKLLDKGINMDNIKGLISTQTGENSNLGDIMKSLEGLKNIGTTKTELEEKLKAQSKDLDASDSPYKEIYKLLNADSTKKKTTQEILEEHK